MPRERDSAADFTADEPGGVPFIEAIDYARSRKAEIAADYYGNAIKAHRAKATTITGAASVAQIRRVMDAMNTVIAEGGTFADWKQGVDVQSLLMPEGRLDNIFRTNVQAAYNRGRYQQQMTSITRTMWMYDAVNDSRTRPSHLAMDGVILPRDDPWWASRYPPNGYRCRCSVIALTEPQASARGGATRQIPADATPDPGWDYNPGADYAAPDAGMLAAGPGSTQAELSALDRTRTGSEARSASYATIQAAGEDSARALLERVGGSWHADSTSAVLDVARAADLKRETDLLLSAVQARSGDEIATLPDGGKAPGKTALLVKRALQRFPATWQKRIADDLRARPLAVQDSALAGGSVLRASYDPLSRTLLANSGVESEVIHQTARFVQDAMPDVETYLAAHHLERTAGDALQELDDLEPGLGFLPGEMTRPDDYFLPVVGREVDGRATDLLSMGAEALWTNDVTLYLLATRDPRLFSLLLGLLLRYA